MQMEILRLSLQVYYYFFIFFSTLVVGYSKKNIQPNLSDFKITSLPGLPDNNVKVSHYAGHITIHDDTKSLFFYFVEADKEPHTKPLLLWLSGGPGCSSLAGGAFLEIGPFFVQENGETLELRPDAWNTEANLLFLESPVGVGFSYTNNTPANGDRSTAEDSYQFLMNWLEIFAKYKSRDFYIAGESYAGHYVPQLSQLIFQRFRGVAKLALNFKGFLLGNPTIDTYSDYMGMFQYWWNHGLISNTIYKRLKSNCKSESSIVKTKKKCKMAMKEAKMEMGRINPHSILDPPCKSEGSDNQSMVFGETDLCLVNSTTRYINKKEVQKALHAQSFGLKPDWKHCSPDVFNNWGDSPKSTLPIIKELVDAGYRVWIVSGDTDPLVPLTSTRFSINALNLNVTRTWYAWYHNGTVGGWSEVYNGLTFLTIKGAGHMFPLYRPQQSLLMFKNFLLNQHMPNASSY